MNNDLEFVIDTVIKAGKLTLSHWGSKEDVRHKSRGNPVTAADLAADELLRREITTRFPSDGWISEETADSKERSAKGRVWVVDPLDGTREFVEGLPEYAVSVALVSGRTPVLGVVYNPAAGDLFYCELGSGVFRNGTPVRVSTRSDLEGSLFLGSRTENADNLLSSLSELGRLRLVGSIAYKLALIAAGDGDLTISFRPKSEWDVCAGAVLLQEAGGIITDRNGEALKFNQEKPIFLGGILACSRTLHPKALDWLRRAARND